MYDIHKKTMLIARKQKAVGEGVFFDLMYVNPHLQLQYAFLRRCEKDLLLVVVNFDDVDVDIRVNIPAHAFDYLEMKEKKVVVTDLLTGEKDDMVLEKDSSVRMTIKARGGRVWKTIN